MILLRRFASSAPTRTPRRASAAGEARKEEDCGTVSTDGFPVEAESKASILFQLRLDR